jgi:hypothetical protein
MACRREVILRFESAGGVDLQSAGFEQEVREGTESGKRSRLCFLGYLLFSKL